MYSGTDGSFIRFNSSIRSWKMSTLNELAWAESSASQISYSMGTSSWTVHEDQRCLNQQSFSTLLGLSTCNNESFSCHDGLCIPIEGRCNNTLECNDGSDEIQCQILKIDQSYNKALPPPSDLGHKVLVNVSVRVVDIIDIDENLNQFRVKFKIYLFWTDQRMTFFNLKSEKTLNRLEWEEIDLMWKPIISMKDIEIYNREINEDESVQIKKPEAPLRTIDIDSVDNAMVYGGNVSIIGWRKMYR